MNARLRAMFILALLVAGPPLMARDDRAAQQAALDAECEAARQATLQPIRRDFIEACVADEGKERPYCEKYYADYGAATGNRGPMFYDLPECEAAFTHRNSQRRRSG